MPAKAQCFTKSTHNCGRKTIKPSARSTDGIGVRRILGVIVALLCAVVVATPAVALSLARAATNNPGYSWALAPLKDLVAHHGWPSSDTKNLGRIATRRELARGLAELMIARGKTPPAGLVRPSDIAANDRDATAISWVSTIRLLGAPGAAFDPNAPITTRTAELAITRIFGLGPELTALSRLHMANGTRIAIPSGFAEEVLAAELGLRHDYPTAYDYLGTYAGAPMPMAELAGMIDGAITIPAWKLASVDNFSSIVLPNLTTNQRTVIQAGLAEVGMPYVWGGTVPRVQDLWGAPTAGGFDCSGLVWWSFKINPASAAMGLGRDLMGRTADQMAWEDPSEKVSIAHLQAGDLLFFGPKGPKSARGSISHTAIALGNGWILQSTGSRGGVSVTHLMGYWDAALAWGRQPASMKATTAVVAHHPAATPSTPKTPAPKPATTTPAPVTPKPAPVSLVPSGSSSGTAQAPAPS